MPVRTKKLEVVPWVGGLNTSVDPGVLNNQELVSCDNVVFSATGARIKRPALQYLDPAVPAADLQSSSGTTRTLKWTTNALVNITSPNERLVVGERISVSMQPNYNVTDTPILSVNSIQQVTTVLCVADVSGSLNNKYFMLGAGDGGATYYVWYNVDSAGVDPAIAGASPIEIAISTDDSDTTVASATNTVINAHDDFNSTVSTATVTITNALGGVTEDGSAGNSGFTVNVTTKGGHSITYAHADTLSESLTETTAVIERASSVIFNTDYWRFTGEENSQLHVYATDDFQLFKLDGGRRTQIQGRAQTSYVRILVSTSSDLTTGDYFNINGPGNLNNYYVWFNIDVGGGDPNVGSRTGIEVAITSSDTFDVVRDAIITAINNSGAFTATSGGDTVEITAKTAGTADPIEDGNTGLEMAVTYYGATVPVNTVRTIRSLVFNNRLLLAFDELGAKPIWYNPDENAKYQLLTDAPDASFLFEFQGRVFANDKTDRDKLHYSPTFDEETWGGIGDSGAIFVGAGDGDPEGILNGYKYKSLAVISKKAKRYRITGESPEEWFVETISEGMGNEGAFSIPVDETDVVFMSRRGVHSQMATDRFGDTDSDYLSAKIKPTFNLFNGSRLKYSQGAYIPELNSIAISVSELGNSDQNAVYLYNFEVATPGEQKPGAWYVWPDISCQSLSRRLDTDRYRLVFGTNNGRLIQAQDTGNFTDFDTTGIDFNVKTGTIYPDGNPNTLKAFKRISMLYRPKGNFSFNVRAKIDNQQIQSFAFNQISGLDLLGTTFILGQSLLGSSSTLAPYSFTMDGIGRGISIEVSQPTAEEQIEIWGYVIEYEYADTMQEVE